MRLLLPFLFMTVPLCAQPVTYPLHIGDSWQYRNAAIMPTDTFTYSYKATSDTLIGGKSYTVISFGNSPTSFERQHSDSVFVRQPGYAKEILYFDFSRSVGDTVSTTVLGGDTMDIVLTEIGIADHFGLSKRAWTFYINRMRHTYDDEYSLKVVDGLGVVYRRPDFGDPTSLVGAVINGTRYGVMANAPAVLPELPRDFRLEQNFPNPFNPATTIRFYLPRPSQVTLEVCNSLGQVVYWRKYSRMSAGSNDLHFVASGLSSGLYFYRIKSDHGIGNGKMMLAK